MARQKKRKVEKQTSKPKSQNKKEKTKVVKQKNTSAARLPKIRRGINESRHSRSADEPVSDEDPGRKRTMATFREVHPSRQQRLKWKPIKKSSIEFIDGVLDQTITTILNTTKPQSYNEVQDNLNALRARCCKRLSDKSAPTTAAGDYKTLHKTLALLEEQVTKTSVQLERLEQELEIEDELKQKQEDELEKSVRRCDTSDIQSNIHPLLTGEVENELNLPRLPASTKSLPKDEKNKKSSLHMVKSLKITTDNDLQQFVTAATNLAENLPKQMET